MNLPELLSLKYPNVDFKREIKLRDIGNGPEIYEWNLSGIPEPTQEDLDKWAIDLAPLYVLAQNKIINQPVYNALVAIDDKSIRAMREGNTQRIEQLETQAAQLRSQLLPIQ